MIDLHMHILPQLDDGAADWDAALTMAYLAADSGVTAVAATSHANLGDLTVEEYRDTLHRFQQELVRQKIPLTVYPGMEIFMGPDVLEKLACGELLTLGNTRYVLVEFDFWEDIWVVNYALECLQNAGYIPVIAHPERYRFVAQNPQEVYEWVLRGYVIQANKGSFLGAFGRREQNVVMSLLRHNLIHLIASDAHGVHHRTPDFGRAIWFLSDYLEPRQLDLLLTQNPQNILDGKPVEGEPPIPYV